MNIKKSKQRRVIPVNHVGWLNFKGTLLLYDCQVVILYCCVAELIFVFVCYRLSARGPQRESSVFSSALDVCSSGRYVDFQLV